MRQSRPSPTSLDPAEAWLPWAPGPGDPWGLKWAGHLHRRAAFGASWRELRESVERGPEATIDGLLSGGEGASGFDRLMDELAPSPAGRSSGAGADLADGLQAWWLHRIFHSPHPLRERMTLFWHDHFATSIAKVMRIGAMKGQNLLIRRHALGSFRPFLKAIGRDPAMMAWLDSNSNVRGRPNENYARELLELFTLGPGHFTEGDVREAARAFTGWHTDGTAFTLDRSRHDDGPKTILGQAGPWDGDDVARIVLDRPEAARFLVRKLYRHLVSEAEPPPDALLEPLAERFRDSDYDIADLVGTMLRSRLFFSDHAYRRRIKGPVEYVAGLYRALQDPGAGEWAAPPPPGLLGGLGQDLFAPPGVEGWPGGPAWLNTATLLARHNLAWRVVQGPRGPLGAPVDPPALVREHAGGREAVDFLLDLLLQPGPGEIAPRARDALARFAAGGDPKGLARDRRLRETTHALLTMPEYQLA